MIEVEKNFDLKPGDKERLIQDAKLIAEKTFTDIYYDTADFRLTTKDYWLRQREGKWELKVPLSEAIRKKETDQYRELEDENDVSAAEKKIMDFARERGIASAPGAGKVIVYIQRNNPAHYQALLKAGVVRAIGQAIPILPPPYIFLGPLLIGIGVNILYPLSIFSINLRWRFLIFTLLFVAGGVLLYWAV